MKQKTRRIIENRRRARIFVEACAVPLPVPLITVTCGGNVLSVNPAARDLIGIHADDAGTPELSDLLVTDDDSDSVVTVVCRTLEPVSSAMKIRTSTGIREVNCTSVPFMGEEDDVLLITILFFELPGNNRGCLEENMGNPVIRQPGTDIQEMMNEWEEILLAFSHGDLRTFPQTGKQDPLSRLKFLYNEGIAAVQKMVSVKDLFG